MKVLLRYLPELLPRQPRSAINITPKTFPQIAQKMLIPLRRRCQLRRGCKLLYRGFSFACQQKLTPSYFLHTHSYITGGLLNGKRGMYGRRAV